MDRKERYENLQVALMAALQGWQADLWTAMPGHIASFDPATQTCEVQPGLKLKITGPAIASLTPGADPTTVPEGSSAWMTLPKLQDCPVHFPSGGGYTLTFPVAVGDECLVVFGSRCIDSWWQSGGIQQQATMRMHQTETLPLGSWAIVVQRPQEALIFGHETTVSIDVTVY